MYVVWSGCHPPSWWGGEGGCFIVYFLGGGGVVFVGLHGLVNAVCVEDVRLREPRVVAFYIVLNAEDGTVFIFWVHLGEVFGC